MVASRKDIINMDFLSVTRSASHQRGIFVRHATGTQVSRSSFGDKIKVVSTVTATPRSARVKSLLSQALTPLQNREMKVQTRQDQATSVAYFRLDYTCVCDFSCVQPIISHTLTGYGHQLFA